MMLLSSLTFTVLKVLNNLRFVDIFNISSFFFTDPGYVSQELHQLHTFTLGSFPVQPQIDPVQAGG